MAAAAVADWSGLNKDLVEVIGAKLDSCSDYIRFRSTCSGWSFLPKTPPKHLQQRRFPYLVLPPKSDTSSSLTHFPLLTSLDLDGEVADQLQTPRLGGRGDDFCFRGFSKGWLIILEKESPSIYLVNPFTGDQKLLPPTNTLPDVIEYDPSRAGKEFTIRPKPNAVDPTPRVDILTYSDMYMFSLRKVVLSSPPAGTNYIAMAIYGEFCDLAYCKYGDERWTDITVDLNDIFNIDDILCYKDTFYAVDGCGRVLVVKFNSSDSSPTTTVIAAQEPMVNNWNKTYLVEVENHLVLVALYIIRPSDDFYETSADKYKILEMSGLNLDFSSSNGRKWSETKLKSLENHVLFLGLNESLSFPSHSFPACKGNLIYFTDDYINGHDELNVRGSDVGVFNLETNTIKRLQRLKHPLSLWPPPIWVMRNKP